MDEVKAWRATEIIPTYEVGAAEKYPVFLEKRVYQGSSGVIYPNAIIEKISDLKVDKEWEVIYLENDFIKIMILPSLGGRVQMAYDKVYKRHFVYHNPVIKPALVGVTGPWIAGGIEFNWPQHHRPSTYSPTESYIEENDDGSKTVWVSEIERMFRTKGMAGFTLYPDKAYLEIKGKLYNRTPHPQTFLWWANPAVAVNDEYQSVFPPDVNAVFDHGKRDVSEFPIAKGKYYKVDYSPGTDISLYKNIPVPTSYMAIKSSYDFVGGYENDIKGGLLHIADHHISPGKKLWTWGNGDFGKAWIRNLTDDDRPYIELMCGVFTDNQPDFSWMHPYEEKSFRQYFMPYHDIGVVKSATKEALLNIEVKQRTVIIKLFVTSSYPRSIITLHHKNEVLFEERIDLSPAESYQKEIPVEESISRELKVIVKKDCENVLITWEPELIKAENKREVPEAAKSAKAPHEIESVEQLYLTGLHLEQYRHATYDPTSYYQEALLRQPGDIRNNNAMGLWLLKRGNFEKALPYFDAAIETLTDRNPNPYNGEPYFNKGLTHKFMMELDKAYNAFYKAAWNSKWKSASLFNLAQIDISSGNYEKALKLLDKSLVSNWHNHKARHLKIVLLRKINQSQEALRLIEYSLDIDRFNFGVLYEKYLLLNDNEYLVEFRTRIRNDIHNFIEISLDYAQAGLYDEALQLMQLCIGSKEKVYPMIYYLSAWFQEQNGNIPKAKEHYETAQKMPIDYCFPNRLEEVVVLQAALSFNDKDAKAAYYLGNFWYAAKQFENAKICWETALKYDGKSNGICHRNLALYYYNKSNQKDLALKEMEKAFSIDHKGARVLMELDQLYKRMNVDVDQRLRVLEENLTLVMDRDDLYLERIGIYNLKGEHERALELIRNRQFHPWEGGEGKVPFQWLYSNVELAKRCLRQGDFKKAASYLISAKSYPHNLGEGKLPIAQENDIDFWLGCAYDSQGDNRQAIQSWRRASQGEEEDFGPAMYYNDQEPDKIYYRGLSLLKLGKNEEAQEIFHKLIDYGTKHKKDEPKIDYFAVSLPDFLIWEKDLTRQNRVHCYYMMGLGYMGLGETGKAKEALEEVIKLELYHFGGHVHLRILETDYETL